VKAWFTSAMLLPAVMLLVAAWSAAQEADTIVLSTQCPPSFEHTADDRCLLRNLYQFYDSLQGQGFGGTQTGLPAHRDGFSPAQIDLGRYLFFDPMLSGDGSLSCASCHQPDKGFADGRARSIGVHGEQISRSAPTLWNVAFLNQFFWDGRSDSLEDQAQGPLYSPEEMGNNEVQLLRSLQETDYVRLFSQAFPEKGLSLDTVYIALTAFQTSLISLNSRYDQYAHGNHDALNANEIKGMNVYRSFVARCSECHMPPLFTNQQIAVIGAPEPEGLPFDIGAEKTYGSAKLKGGFKVPTLRNIATTAPYMHSGVFDTLRESVDFYSKGRGNAVPEGLDLQLHWHISEPDLTDEEIDRVVDFLHALTDETLMPEIPRHLPSGRSPLAVHPADIQEVLVKR
jgi:cytochrome c peroxidase